METVDWRSLLPQHRLLQELVDFNDEVAVRTGSDPQEALNDIGLLLRDSTGPSDMTPRNVVEFASTGMDGSHYSLLPLEGHPPDRYPVVLTVPMALHEDKTRYNHIVGENLREFLNLGCYYGYIAVDSLAFDGDRDELVRDLVQAHPVEDDWPEKLELLAEMRERFSLKPWPDVAGRLRQLKKQYFHLLDVDWSSFDG